MPDGTLARIVRNASGADRAKGSQEAQAEVIFGSVTGHVLLPGVKFDNRN
jgi:hypothetical protein